jgi:hypothetical protein
MAGHTSKRTIALCRSNIRLARSKWRNIDALTAARLKAISIEQQFSLAAGDLILLEAGWYVTHTGLIRLANRRRCIGIEIQPVSEFCDIVQHRYAFKAIVYRSKQSAGFCGYGDADPSNVSYLVQGAEMRVAETRAVNRALRKAYGIGICSVEEIGSVTELQHGSQDQKKLPPQPATGNGGVRSVRDRLCQIIRQHDLDPNLVKAYAADFCGTKTVREATREQVKNFVQHLADWAEKDRSALLCQLNSYMSAKEGAA